MIRFHWPPSDPVAFLMAVLVALAFLMALAHAWARAADRPPPRPARCTECPCGCIDLPDTCRCSWTHR